MFWSTSTPVVNQRDNFALSFDSKEVFQKMMFTVIDSDCLSKLFLCIVTQEYLKGMFWCMTFEEK